jgi:hypothetical protein
MVKRSLAVDAMSDSSVSAEKKSLVVHLQVWHYRASEGRSIDANNAFANLFRGTADWEVVQTEFHAVAGLNSHDRYVPVEVSRFIPSFFQNTPALTLRFLECHVN